MQRDAARGKEKMQRERMITMGRKERKRNMAAAAMAAAMVNSRGPFAGRSSQT